MMRLAETADMQQRETGSPLYALSAAGEASPAFLPLLWLHAVFHLLDIFTCRAHPLSLSAAAYRAPSFCRLHSQEHNYSILRPPIKAE
jgi:hypothetical protein